MLCGDFQAPAIARGQQLTLAATPATPNGTNGVNDVTREQPESRCELRIACFAALELATSGQQLRPRRAMDCAIDAASAQ